VNLLAGVAEKLGAVGTLDGGLFLLTQLTLGIIGINRILALAADTALAVK